MIQDVGDGAPESAVVRLATIVAHHEVVPGRNRDRVGGSCSRRRRRRRTVADERLLRRLAVADHAAVADRDRVARAGDDALDEVHVGLLGRRACRTRRPCLGCSPHWSPVADSAPTGGWKTTMSPTCGIAEVRADAVDEHALADVERRHHRLARDAVRLDEERLDRRAPGPARRRRSRRARAASSPPTSRQRCRACSRLIVCGGRRRPRPRPPRPRPAAPRRAPRARPRRPPPRREPPRRPRRPRRPRSPPPRARRPRTASTSVGLRSDVLRRSLVVQQTRLDRRPRARRSGARAPGRACRRGRAGSRAWRAARRRGRRPRSSRSSASAPGTCARRRRRTTACGP